MDRSLFLARLMGPTFVAIAVCTENLSSGVVVMKSAQDGA
jgi:hypothetical protein